MDMRNTVETKQQPQNRAVEELPRKYNFSLWNIWVASSLLKILLFPTYHSTDFDVHRNWLSITKLLPLRQWYFEHTSQWTLDYPPFFAYFEWILSRFVPEAVARDGCIKLTAKDGEYGYLTVIFQRSTVIISEIVLFLALQRLIDTSRSLREKKRNFVIASSIALSPGFFIIDHIHFQYNGFLFAFLVLSLVEARLGNYRRCAFWFAVLLCLKHIFLYMAPAYFVYLLSGFCLKHRKIDTSKSFGENVKQVLFDTIIWRHLFQLGLIVIGVFTVAFGPFVYYGELDQVMSRLFPFSRGLTHAYWAPNFWALYSFVDRILIQLGKNIPGFERLACAILKKSRPVDYSGASSLTRGIVGDVEFVFLPQILPVHTFMLTLFYQILCLIPLFFRPSYERFLGALTYCAWTSFLFGWHVHEKAILLAIIPYSFCVIQDRKLLPSFELLATAGYISLFPLLFGSAEWLFKALITFVWVVVFNTSFNEVCHFSTTLARRAAALDRINLIYEFLMVPFCLFIQMTDVESRNFPILDRLQFLRLMAYSVYCGAGVLSSWNSFSWLYFMDDSVWEEKKEW
ncbi:hypothetical protein BRETT_005177 [Brettanomyces bruxellensis]|uniref:Alpha-1,3-glucosyltransferase n=1 Tax=Dekkera bruxellensis TaxID=5007 RepID=A0A871QY57_DEKBR|nr:uncharacterized protein BRETT_005177 [Brettanomyces bruxellensis]QOU18117.1 hypothetical protein BRETT_005177 [Brettanomyces bruxellensis]